MMISVVANWYSYIFDLPQKYPGVGVIIIFKLFNTNYQLPMGPTYPGSIPDVATGTTAATSTCRAADLSASPAATKGGGPQPPSARSNLAMAQGPASIRSAGTQRGGYGGYGGSHHPPG